MKLLRLNLKSKAGKINTKQNRNLSVLFHGYKKLSKNFN
jgi:hypothetical protein